MAPRCGSGRILDEPIYGYTKFKVYRLYLVIYIYELKSIIYSVYIYTYIYIQKIIPHNIQMYLFDIVLYRFFAICTDVYIGKSVSCVGNVNSNFCGLILLKWVCLKLRCIPKLPSRETDDKPLELGILFFLGLLKV